MIKTILTLIGILAVAGGGGYFGVQALIENPIRVTLVNQFNETSKYLQISNKIGNGLYQAIESCFEYRGLPSVSWTRFSIDMTCYVDSGKWKGHYELEPDIKWVGSRTLGEI